MIVIRSVRNYWRRNEAGRFGWGWGLGAGRRSDNDVDSGNVDLELQAQFNEGLTDEQRAVDGILRQAGERRRVLREKGRVVVKGGGKRGRGREKVEWGNREEMARVKVVREVLIIEK
jgi:hypothetical protein